MSDGKVCEAFSMLVDVMLARGVRQINDRPGLTEVRIGKFLVRVNPHRETIDAVPPFMAHVAEPGMFLPSMFIYAYGGTIAGNMAIEDDFLAACRMELRQVASALEVIP